MLKLQDLPDDYEPPVVSVRAQGQKKVLIEGPEGVFYGWEDKDGGLHPMALIEPSSDHKKRQEEDRRALKGKAERNANRKAAIQDLRRRRLEGEDMTTEDLNMLADLMLGI